MVTLAVYVPPNYTAHTEQISLASAQGYYADNPTDTQPMYFQTSCSDEYNCTTQSYTTQQWQALQNQQAQQQAQTNRQWGGFKNFIGSYWIWIVLIQIGLFIASIIFMESTYEDWATWMRIGVIFSSIVFWFVVAIIYSQI